jgi:hypothetical protein
VNLFQLAVILLAAVGLIAMVSAFARDAGRPPRSRDRTVTDPDGPDWLNLEAASAHLDTEPGLILGLVDRGSIPFFVVEGGNRADQSSLYFRRDELDAWTVG